jgi:dTDP-4-amino-4,6-dideoxygalactose transaminase
MGADAFMTEEKAIGYVDLPRQHAALKSEILAAVDRVLTHGQFILGPEVAELEHRLAALLRARHVVGVANGTDALMLGLRLAGVGPGDQVITVSHSFVATGSAIAMLGAVPVFVDVDERTMLMDPGLVGRAITPRTKAILPVHLNGFACDLAPLQDICQRRGLALVEDVAQAIGARYHGRCVGTFGIGCGSLHPLKILSACGDAGYVVVDDDATRARLTTMRNIGLVDRDHCAVVSSNSRLDTLQAAILLVKLDHLERFQAARRAHAAAYRAALGGHVVLPPEDDGAVYSAFVVRHERRDALQEHLRRHGVDAKVHYPVPIHRQKAFSEHASTPLPVTERTVARILSLPVTPELTVADREHVIRSVLAFPRSEAS